MMISITCHIIQVNCQQGVISEMNVWMFIALLIITCRTSLMWHILTYGNIAIHLYFHLYLYHIPFIYKYSLHYSYAIHSFIFSSIFTSIQLFIYIYPFIYYPNRQAFIDADRAIGWDKPNGYLTFDGEHPSKIGADLLIEIFFQQIVKWYQWC